MRPCRALAARRTTSHSPFPAQPAVLYLPVAKPDPLAGIPAELPKMAREVELMASSRLLSRPATSRSTGGSNGPPYERILRRRNPSICTSAHICRTPTVCAGITLRGALRSKRASVRPKSSENSAKYPLAPPPAERSLRRVEGSKVLRRCSDDPVFDYCFAGPNTFLTACRYPYPYFVHGCR